MSSAQAVYAKHRTRRVVLTVLFYLLLFAIFIFVMYEQASKVNTLEFAAGQIQLTTSKTKYTVGDTVDYKLTNGLNTPITLLFDCPNPPFHVYQWTNNQWVSMSAQAKASACVNQPKQIKLNPGQSISKNYSAWPSLFNKPGIYRIVAYANNYTALPYADFQVVDKPAPAPAPLIIYKPVYTPIYVPTSGGDHSSGGGSDN